MRTPAEIERAKELLSLALQEADAIQAVEGVRLLRMLLACIAWVQGDPADPFDIGFTNMIETLDRQQRKAGRPH
jgi:hypothetical protein